MARRCELLREAIAYGRPRTRRPWRKILVMVEGRIVGEFDPRVATRADIGAAMIGGADRSTRPDTEEVSS